MSATLHRTEGSEEPVAWEVRNAEISFRAVFGTEREARLVADEHDESGYSQAVVRALFYATAPSGWQPLTGAQLNECARDAQIDFCMDKASSFEVAFARRIEAAHGIKQLSTPPAPNQGEAS